MRAKVMYGMVITQSFAACAHDPECAYTRTAGAYRISKLLIYLAVKVACFPRVAIDPHLVFPIEKMPLVLKTSYAALEQLQHDRSAVRSWFLQLIFGGEASPKVQVENHPDLLAAAKKFLVVQA